MNNIEKVPATERGFTVAELQVIHYGLSWLDIPEMSSRVYRDGVLDAIAHQVACLISQTHNVSVPTSDVANFLKFNMSVDEIAEAITEYLKD